MKLHLYTVAQKEEFVISAFRCAESFTKLNPEIKFTVFIYDDKKTYATPCLERVEVKYVDSCCKKFFGKDYLKERPYADLLLYKYGGAPMLIAYNDQDATHIGQIDSDALCLKPLPMEILKETMGKTFFACSPDPRSEVRKAEINKSIGIYHEWGGKDSRMYFNSGVMFWPRNVTAIFEKFPEWVKKWAPILKNAVGYDQTWLNMYFFQNGFYIRELGYYWNFRSELPIPRTIIWHPGGRNTNGLELLKQKWAALKK